MNIFDAEHPSDLGGLFSKIKKAVKSVNRLRNKIDDKIQKVTLGNKLSKKLDEVKHSKAFTTVKTVVATAVGTYVAGPLGAAAVQGMIANDAMKKNVRAEIKNAELQAQYDEQYSREIDEVLALSNDPDMQRRIITMLEAGKTPAEIKQEWVASNMFAVGATNAATAAATPVVVDALISQGIPSGTAEAIAPSIANEAAVAEVANVKNSTASAGALIPLAVLALSFLG